MWTRLPFQKDSSPCGVLVEVPCSVKNVRNMENVFLPFLKHGEGPENWGLGFGIELSCPDQDFDRKV